MKPSILKQTGSVLIEALIALVVVGVGTFGVVKLNTVLLKGTGDSKTRAEALQLAQKRIEDLRNFSVQTGCPAAETSTEASTVAGVNASYKIGRTISSVLAERVNVDVYVGWDGATDPRNSAADKSIVLNSVVSCLGAGTSAMIGGNASGLTGGKVKTPTGVARVGGRDNPTCPNGSCVSTINNTNGKADNTKIYTTGSLVELVDTVTNKVLLTIEDGSAFSTISGRVYIEANNSGNPIVDPDGSIANDGTQTSIQDDNVFVLSSDASYCARIFPTDAASTIPASTSGSAIKYRYFDYNCYVSKGWWGNIGVVRLDNPNSNNRVCLGDVAVASSETSIWSRKAAMSISRSYRSYRKINAGGSNTEPTNFETVGIGYSLGNDGTVSSTYTPVNLGTSADTNHHDFLITVITGQGTCEDSGKMTLTGTTASNTFTSNVGKFYCMSGQCPSLTETVSTQTTVIHGTITKASGAVLTGIDSADCQTTPTFTVAADGNSYSYSCTKVWTGFAGSAWQGGVTFVASGTSTLCGPGTATVVPSGSSVVFTVNDSNAGNTISFSDVQLGVTDIAINFSVEPSSCNTLGTPAPVWPTVPGSNNDALSWTAITGATGYKVKTCTDTAALNTTACTPNSTATSQAGTSYAPSVSNNSRLCIIVAASNASGDGSYSVTPRCVRRSGGTYTHQ